MTRLDGTRRFDWPRFWVAQGGTISLSDGGYLVDPLWEAKSLGRTQLKTLAELDPFRGLVLLGEPGMGKSIALETEADRRRAMAEHDVSVIHADLRAYSSDHLLYKKVFEDPRLQAWKQGSGQLLLQLDSLDEALLRIETVAALIADELPTLPVERLSVRIACRTVTWQTIAPTLLPVFKTLWGADAAGVYEIAPLRRGDVLAAAAQWPVNVDAFVEQVRMADAVPFAIKPLTLGLLLRLFHSDGRLPESIADLYRQGCLSLCEEQNPNRRATRRDGQLAPRERLALAGRMAAVSMLANRYAIWTGPESQVAPQEDVALAELAVGTEPGQTRRIDLSRETLREALDTGLFSSRGDERMGWAHQSFAEFLAADYLIGRGISPRNFLDILRHPSGGLVPQLGVVAAWAASLSKDIRRELIEHEPMVLLHGDLAGWEADDLSALTAALLRCLDEKVAHDFSGGLSDRYGKLAHPGLAAMLRPYIQDAGRGLVARRVAMRIAKACSLRELEADLLALALDANAEPHMRACAVSALATCGEGRSWRALTPLALDAPGPDPDREIKGTALQILWPDHLEARELFQHLTPPRESYYGAYTVFLTDTLPQALKRDDLPFALEWATEFVRGINHRGEFVRRELADAILSAAWSHIQDPEITSLVLRYAQAAIGAHYELFVGHDREDQDAFRKNVIQDVQGRRAFLRAAIAAPHSKTFAYSLAQAGLLQRDDLGWILSLWLEGEAAAFDVDEVALSDFVQAALDLSDETHFSALYDAAERWPLLRSKYSGLLDGVPLDSPAAAELKKYHDMTTQHSRRPRPTIAPPPAQRVRECLDRFDNGEIHAWWQMNRELTLKPDSTHYGSDLQYRIVDMPGWGEADEVTRARILVSAARFLEHAVPTVDQWIGKNSVNFSDLAALRALVLLREFEPTVYAELSPALWQKWAPAIVALPQETGTEQSKVLDEILADATAKASTEVASTVLTLIRCERRRHEDTAESSREGVSSFSFLRRIKSDCHSVPLWEGLLQELADEANTPEQFATLLDVLLDAKVESAKHLALGRFEAWLPSPRDRTRAGSAAAVLLKHDAAAYWPQLWPAFLSDIELGREVILRLGRFHGWERPFFADLREGQLGDLYVWLARAFPHSEDPVHDDGPHWMAPRDSVVHLRDDVLAALANRGTPEAVVTLRSLIARLPELPWLAFRLVDADQLMRQRTWLPLTPNEVLSLIECPEGRLVQSASQLADILVEVLRRYEQELHGEQSPIRSLWDRQSSGSLLRPVEEDAISDHVKLFLQRELVERGVVVNREVEVARAVGAPVGKRTDIRVNAVRKANRAEAFDQITAVIETKGCWNGDLMTAMQTQLRDEYLARIGAPVGIYLVGWFDKAKWDPADYRRGKAPAWDVAEAQRQLDEQASGLSGGFLIRALVLDCHAP